MRAQRANNLLDTPQAGTAPEDLGNSGDRPSRLIENILPDGLLPLKAILLLDAKHDHTVCLVFMGADETKAAALLGRKGGKARAEALSEKQRRAIARKAAAARWAAHGGKRPTSSRKKPRE